MSLGKRTPVRIKGKIVALSFFIFYTLCALIAQRARNER